MKDFNSYLDNLDYSLVKDLFHEKGKQRIYHKKDFFIRQNEISRFAEWVENGTFQYTYIDGEGEEHIVGYAFTNEFVCDNHNKNEADAVDYQLEAGELFKSPWTIGTVNAKEKFQKDAYRYSDISGFYYNASDKVKRHPIYTKEIGDPRWRTGKSWDGGKNHTVKSGDLTY